jgi:hypothetical protein
MKTSWNFPVSYEKAKIAQRSKRVKSSKKTPANRAALGLKSQACIMQHVRVAFTIDKPPMILQMG